MSSDGSAAKVAIIIPSWTGEISRLLHSIEQQTFRDYKVEVVTGVSPVARARNVGIRRTTSEIVVFIDDDAYFGHEDCLRILVDLLESDPRIGVVGTSKLAPPSASALQRAISRQVPRMVYPTVRRNQVSNPPLDRYGFTAITGTCCAIPRRIFEELGMFDEEMITGPEDVSFFAQVRRGGYNLMVAANCWVYHDPPPSMRDLLRKSFWYGVGHAQSTRKTPERGLRLLALNRWYGKATLLASVLAFPAAFFVHLYFDPKRKILLGFRPLKTLSTYAVLCGYVYGWYNARPRQEATTYRGVRGGAAQP
ncbi:MAG TPA: glycosyltransferase [Chloroflexota bacterium]|nr:glycosyltransferase [Chloroflexota bacterium]